MKLLRLALASTLLLLAAFPPAAFACGVCSEVAYDQCDRVAGSGTRCRFTIDTCTTVAASWCTGFTDTDAVPPILADWTVLSVEISRPDGTKDVTAPVAVASAETAAPAVRK